MDFCQSSSKICIFDSQKSRVIRWWWQTGIEIPSKILYCALVQWKTRSCFCTIDIYFPYMHTLRLLGLKWDGWKLNLVYHACQPYGTSKSYCSWSKRNIFSVVGFRRKKCQISRCMIDLFGSYAWKTSGNGCHKCMFPALVDIVSVSDSQMSIKPVWQV